MLNGKCFQTDAGGLAPGDDDTNMSHMIVYDPDAPCDPEGSYIHFTPTNDWAPMTAGKGPLTHTYIAANFDDATVQAYASKVGTCALTPTNGAEVFRWRVSSTPRGGSCETGDSGAFTSLPLVGALLALVWQLP